MTHKNYKEKNSELTQLYHINNGFYYFSPHETETDELLDTYESYLRHVFKLLSIQEAVD